MQITKNTEITIEAVIKYAEKEMNQKLHVVEVSNSDVKLVLPVECTPSSVTENFTEDLGVYFTDENNEDITAKAVITIFSSDVNDFGNFVVGGIESGTLVIGEKSEFNEEELEEMLSYQ